MQIRNRIISEFINRISASDLPEENKKRAVFGLEKMLKNENYRFRIRFNYSAARFQTLVIFSKTDEGRDFWNEILEKTNGF